MQSEQAPAGVELHEPEITVLVETEVAPPFELRRRELNAQLPTILDHAAVALRHPRRRAAFALAAASVAGFRATLDAADFVEVHTPKVVGRRDRERRERVPGRLVRATGRSSRRARSSTSRSWSVCSSACTRSGRCSVPNPTTPRAISRSTCRSMPSSASSATTVTSCRCSATVLDGMVQAMRERARACARRARPRPPRRTRATFPRSTSREAQAMIERATGERVVGEPDLAPAHERWLGEWARARARIRLRVRQRLPDGEATVLHPSRPEAARVLEQLRSDLPRVGARDRWAAPPPRSRLPGRARRRGPRALRGVPRSVPVRHAPARRVRDRPRALDRAGDRRRQHPRDHAVPRDRNRLTP